MGDLYIGGLPGMRAPREADYRRVLRQGDYTYLALGKVIDGTKSRDPDNTSDTDKLRAGVLMGKVSASGKYANAIIGLLAAAATSSATSLTLTVQAAIELVRRIGSSGTFTLTGPSTANGTMHNETVTYSAVNTTTGVVTCSAITNAYVLGSFVGDTDGSQLPITLIPDGFPLKVTDQDGNNQDQEYSKVPVAGVISATQIVNWPTDTSLINWIETNMSTQAAGKFVFDSSY